MGTCTKLTTEPRGEQVVALVLARLRSPRVLLSLAHRRLDDPSASPRIADPIEVTADGGDVKGTLVGVPEGAVGGGVHTDWHRVGLQDPALGRRDVDDRDGTAGIGA